MLITLRKLALQKISHLIKSQMLYQLSYRPTRGTLNIIREG